MYVCMYVLPLVSLHAVQLKILKNCSAHEENYLLWHSVSSYSYGHWCSVTVNFNFKRFVRQ